MKDKKRLFGWLGVIIAIIVGLRVLTNRGFDTDDNGNFVQAVEVAEAKYGRIEGKLFYTGDISGINEAMLISQTAGVVVKENVKVGDFVIAGQTLFVIENEMQKANVEQAKAQFLAAETNYEKAQKDFERIEKLYNENVATKDNLELSQLNTKATLASMKGAEAALKVAEKQLADTYISAKFSGKLGSKKVNIGSTVAPGVEIGKVVDDSKLKIIIMVSENDISKIQKGQNVNIEVEAIKDGSFTGKIFSVGLATDRFGRSYQVEIVIDNSTNRDIKSGMFAKCEVGVDRKDTALVIPEKALFNREEKSSKVFIVEDGKAIEKDIVLGIKTTELIEILSGISEGDKVVVSGQQRLENNMPVVIK
jgi:RND family efflux transporter MFP subunit